MSPNVLICIEKGILMVNMLGGVLAAPLSLTVTIPGTRLNILLQMHYRYIEVRMDLHSTTE